MKFNLTVTNEELNLLGAGLGKLPYDAVVKLIGKLQQQVTIQQTPKAPVETINTVSDHVAE